MGSAASAERDILKRNRNLLREGPDMMFGFVATIRTPHHRHRYCPSLGSDCPSCSRANGHSARSVQRA